MTAIEADNKPATSIAGSLLRVDEIATGDRDAMYDLLDRHFSGVTRIQFDIDLAEKNWALLLRNGSGELVGFSTLQVYYQTVAERRITVVCSGDTIVDPSAWSSAALPREWIGAIFQLRAVYGGPVYWLLITSGFRTYRLLSTFWQNFYPRFDQPTPHEDQYLLDQLASGQFDNGYDRVTGIVKLKHPQLLRAPLAGIPAARLADAHVSFFDARNPGHALGDELACLCELCESNLTRAGRRVVRSAMGGRAK